MSGGAGHFGRSNDLISSWAQDETAVVNFGDERLDQRAANLLWTMGNRPNLSLNIDKLCLGLHNIHYRTLRDAIGQGDVDVGSGSSVILVAGAPPSPPGGLHQLLQPLVNKACCSDW